MKKKWVEPRILVQEFMANEYVSVCYKIGCKGGPSTLPADISAGWDGQQYGSNIQHSSYGTSGTCGDPSSNRILDKGVIQEHNKEQGWISGAIDNYIDRDNNGSVTPGDIVFWHTFSGNKDRRWNHWGYAEQADASHPNHS